MLYICCIFCKTPLEDCFCVFYCQNVLWFVFHLIASKESLLSEFSGGFVKWICRIHLTIAIIIYQNFSSLFADIPILFIFLLKSTTDWIHTIFIFQHEKQNEKYTFIPFISRVYYLKWTIKRSNFYEGLTLCRFKYNFDRLERDKSKFDWRKYKIHLDEYVCLPDWESKICRPFRKTNIFVIIGQTFDVEKYAQNHVNSL